jgi:hypothetical protein
VGPVIENYRKLADMLRGQRFAGSNARYDAARIYRELQRDPEVAGCARTRNAVEEPWHYKLLELASYATGVLGLDPAEPPSLHEVCRMLDIVNEEEHGAMGDARATAACIRRLRDINASRRTGETEPWHGKATATP